MRPEIRVLENRDRPAVVALSLRAWAPVFVSLEAVLGGSGVFARLHPDWRASQQRAVEATCDAEDIGVWVAEVDGVVAAFVAVRLDHRADIGQIYMVAVDPEHQRSGIGSALTSFALQQIKASGVAVAMVETGGDPGHAPARRTYERAGFVQLPIIRYFKRL